MWILMYVFSYSVSPAATNDRAEWRLLPTVVFQEFSNEERCKTAKSTLEGSLKEAGAKLKSGLAVCKKLGPRCDLCNNSIKSGRILNQSCVAASILESMLLTDHSKNLFQQTASSC